MEEMQLTHWKPVGESPGLQGALLLIERAAGTHQNVLLTGERGTGKKAAARMLHQLSPHGRGPLVQVSCAAKPEALLRQELLGALGGGKAGAARTLLLDEVVALPHELQADAARILAARPREVRVVATTSSDLTNPIVSAQFRDDLFELLRQVVVELPPLRARGTDVLLLAQHFLKREAKSLGRKVVRLGPAAAERLLTYEWPGNIRELRSCVAHAVALARHEAVLVEDLPERIQAHTRNATVRRDQVQP